MEEAWLEGRISVEAALRGKNRRVDRIFVQQGKKERPLRSLFRAAKVENIAIEYKEEDFFENNARGKSHGGVLALVGPRQFCNLEDLLQEHSNPFVFMLDGVEDPFNFGQAIRAIYAAGASGLVVRRRNWLSAVDVVARSSAGASELMAIAEADSALAAADFYRQRGLSIACTARKSAASLFEADLSMPLFILIGGEKRGITRSFLDQADLRIQIPYGRRYRQSLGVVSSAAIIAFEISRKRNFT